MGRFLMSGYTEMDDSGDAPVFIRTLGDELVLWFDLDQDINALNGNKEVFVVADTDGFDQRFGFPKTNMGRGALLIRHTDYRNSDTKPIPYLDYLAAGETGTANTRVVIREEGEYEVALDYEVNDSNVLHSLSKLHNYRIAFRFTVKNGSDMFFMFDKDNGSELQDYARTNSGFRVDLANSHVLKIYVERQAINQAGTALDVRSSAPAADKEEFDRVGYYEITVTNTETGKTLTKHVFVGSDEDLANYQRIDPSLMIFGTK